MEIVLGESSKINLLSVYGNTIMFTARNWDVESGNYYYRARMYSPNLGRFLQPDPIGYADNMNMYSYCGNNPMNWIDPMGLSFGDCFSGAQQAAIEAEAKIMEQYFPKPPMPSKPDPMEKVKDVVMDLLDWNAKSMVSDYLREKTGHDEYAGPFGEPMLQKTFDDITDMLMDHLKDKLKKDETRSNE
jgi:RHS repeat-associated protein